MSDYIPTPLTLLTEDEQMIKEMLHDFGAGEIAPRAAKMDAEGKMDPAVPAMLFEQDIMGIEIPEKYGGAEQSFFMACLAVEILSE